MVPLGLSAGVTLLWASRTFEEPTVHIAIPPDYIAIAAISFGVTVAIFFVILHWLQGPL
jgi:preprotein translocase subunit Sec61beta